jgi:hypothetical protein
MSPLLLLISTFITLNYLVVNDGSALILEGTRGRGLSFYLGRREVAVQRSAIPKQAGNDSSLSRSVF